MKIRPDIDGVRLRESPVSGKPVGQVHIGEVIESLESEESTRQKVGQDGQWLRVRTSEGLEAYVAAWLLLPFDIPGDTQPIGVGRGTDQAPPVEKPTVATQMMAVRPVLNSLRLRAKPAVGEIVGLVNVEDVLVVAEDTELARHKIGRDGEWMRVRTLTGLEAYIAAWFIDLHEGPVPQVNLVPQSANITGVNLDVFHPLGAPDAKRMEGMGWVRFVYNVSAGRGTEDLKLAYQRHAPHIERYTEAGFKVMLCFTHQTYGEGKNEFWPWNRMTSEKWRRLTARFADIVGSIVRQYAGQNLIHAYQIWNEQDAPQGAEASVSMRPTDYAHLLQETIRTIRGIDLATPIITGGHTGGPTAGADYARQVIKAIPEQWHPDGIAFHPYGRGINQDSIYTVWGHIDESMRAYLGVMPGKPVWITEWGVLDRPGDSPHDILNYAAEVIQHLRSAYPGRVASMIWYPWAMTMHNGYGLVDDRDQPLQPLYDEFRRL